MKKFTEILLIFLMIFICAGCSNAEKEPELPEPEAVPQLSQVRSVCELAVVDCYYHNVAKSFEADVEGILLWKKDRHFWIEYDAVVKYGIDVSKVDISVADGVVNVTLPRAKLLECTIDDPKEFSYIVAKNSAKISAEDEKAAIEKAQTDLRTEAAENVLMIEQAQQRAEELLTEYIDGLASLGEKSYSVRFTVLDEGM